MRWYQRLSTKLSLPILLTVALFALAIGFLYARSSLNNLLQEAQDRRNLRMEATQEKLETTNRLILEKIQTSMRILKKEGAAQGKPSLEGATKVAGIDVFDLKLGAVSQSNNSQLVDNLKELTGSQASVFVKNGEGFLRIATNIQKGDGSRALGTILDPNSRAAFALKQGKPYYGVSNLFDKPFFTGYEPMFDERNQLVGAWFVGYPIDSLSELEQSVSNSKVLEKGFLALVNNEGDIIFKSKDADENTIKKAASIASNEEAVDEWQVKKINFEPWNYTIVSAYSSKDPIIVKNSQEAILNVAIGTVVFTGFLMFLILWLTNKYLQPLRNAVKIVNQIAEGNLNVSLENLETDSKDETGQMLHALQSVVNYLKEMAGIADKIAEGNMQVTVRPRSEKDVFGLAFKNMLERTLKLVQTQEERNRLQNSILKLLNEVADVANGDLTAEAEVTPDMTGAIADAFNFMISELRQIISRVKTATYQVDSSTNEVQQTTENLVRGNEMQVLQISRASAEIEEMVSSIQKVSENIKISTEVTEQSLMNAKHGTQAVQSNITAMNRIRQQVQETAKRVQRLGERSQEIGDIVKLIDDLAYRTSVLALNASIQAQAAGEAGRGFAVVAEEVEHLAERSTNATKQIAALTKAIQGETTEVVSSIEITIKEVSNGSQLVNEVGRTLSEIESVAKKLAEINHQVFASAELQNRRSTTIYQTMRDVAEISEKNASGMKNSVTNVNQLTALAKDLRASVASFKLPPNYGAKTELNKKNYENNSGYVLSAMN